MSTKTIFLLLFLFELIKQKPKTKKGNVLLCFYYVKIEEVQPCFTFFKVIRVISKEAQPYKKMTKI